MRLKILSLLLILFAILPSHGLSNERGTTGIVFTLDAEGMFWNPTIRSLKVDKVLPNSAAEMAGIKAGDEIMEIAGTPVIGAKSKDLMPYLQKDVGQSVIIKIKRPTGEILNLTLVLMPKSK